VDGLSIVARDASCISFHVGDTAANGNRSEALALSSALQASKPQRIRLTTVGSGPMGKLNECDVLRTSQEKEEKPSQARNAFLAPKYQRLDRSTDAKALLPLQRVFLCSRTVCTT
jgi:hypothetical protein